MAGSNKNKGSGKPPKKIAKTDPTSSSKKEIGSGETNKDNSEPKREEYPVIKSPIDSQGYLAVKFGNGLKALVISTLNHELGVGVNDDKGINPETGVFFEVETFNRQFVGIPEEGCKPNGKPTKSDSRGDCAKSWEPEIRPTRVIGKRKPSRLENPGLQNLAFVCVTVGAGSIHDPEKFPGMAHICEHACASFGSDNYPGTNLMEAVSAAGGIVNAVTFQQVTCYLFIVDMERTEKAGFEKLLHIMSDSISNTVIGKERLATEVKAVDCEFGLSEACDANRLWMLICSTAKQNHPFRRFSCGNSKTLENDNLHKALLKWKDRHYAPNFMTVSVKAPLAVQELKEMVEKYFGHMKPSTRESPRDELMSNHKNPFTTKEFTMIYKVLPVKEQCQLMTLTWVLDAKFANNANTQPFAYLGSFFSSGSSFMDFLRSKHWAYDIVASNPFGSERNPLCSTFCVMLELTDAGVKAHELIIKAIFGYLKMLVNHGPQEAIFNELRQEKADSFHYGDQIYLTKPKRPDLFELVGLGTTLVDLNELKYVLTTRALITKFDPKIIQECTKSLTPRNLNVMISSKTFDGISNLTERWHGTKYAMENFKEGFLKQCERVKETDYKEFNLPEGNPFRQRNISCSARNCHMEPQQMKTNKMAAVYSKTDLCSRGKFPVGLYCVSLASPLTSSSMASQILLEVWLMMLRNNLRKQFHWATKARITAKALLSPKSPNILNLIVDGPPANHGNILKSMLENFKNLKVTADPISFEDEKSYVMKLFKDATLNPCVFAEDLLQFTLQMHHRLIDQVLSEVQTVNIDDFERFIKVFKARMFIQMAMVGCIDENSAIAASKMVGTLEYGELPEILSQDLPRAMLLPLGERCIRVKSRNISDQTSRVVNHYQFGNLHPSVVSCFARLLAYPAFVQLRSKDNLSYAVQVVPEIYCGCTGLSIKVAPQPHVHTTGYVDERIDQFLFDFHQTLATGEEHEKFRAMLPLFETFLLPGGENYRKLSVQVVAQVAEGKTCSPMQPKKLKEKIAQVNGGNNNCRQGKGKGQGIAKPKAGEVDLGIDVPKDYQEKYGYFITDLVAFKNSLPTLGRRLDDDDDSS